MSILNIGYSEEIHIKEDKDYRKAVKNRLKEIIADKDAIPQDRADALRMISEYYPSCEWRSKDEYVAKYRSIVLGRLKSSIPIIYCITCGRKSDRVREFQDTDLIKERRKTWRRIIKPNLNLPLITVHNKKMRVRRLFLAYSMLDCVKKRHKLQIKYVDKTIKQAGFAY